MTEHVKGRTVAEVYAQKAALKGKDVVVLMEITMNNLLAAGELDARDFLPHLGREDYPAWSLVNALYLEGGLRGVEIGNVIAVDRANPFAVFPGAACVANEGRPPSSRGLFEPRESAARASRGAGPSRSLD